MINPAADLSCPTCGSANTQKVSIAHDAGSSSSTSRGGGLTLSHRGGVGVFGGGGVTHGSTALARKLAPPPSIEETVTGKAGSVAVVLVIGFLVVGNVDLSTNARVIIGIVAVAVIFSVFSALDTWLHGAERARWEKLFVCLRCGHIWERADHDRSYAPLVPPAPSNCKWCGESVDVDKSIFCPKCGGGVWS